MLPYVLVAGVVRQVAMHALKGGPDRHLLGSQKGVCEETEVSVVPTVVPSTVFVHARERALQLCAFLIPRRT